MQQDITINLAKLHDAQQAIVDGAARFNVLNCGRRFGKDILGQDLLINAALDGHLVAWFAPTYRMLLDNFREITEIVRPIATSINASDHRIELVTKGVIDMWSLQSEVTRGRKYKRIVINEASMVSQLEDKFQKVLRPTLADYRGDAWFLSTPRGFNDFHSLYLRDQNSTEWRSWTYPTSANPYISPDEIEAMRREMPEIAFRQEILAEFVAVEGALFQREQFHVIDKAPAGLKTIRSYDLALTVKEASDRSASLRGGLGADPCPCHGILDPVYLMDGFATKSEYPDVKQMMLRQAQIDGPSVWIVIESVAFQLAAVQELRREPQLMGYTIIADRPTKDKIARLRPAQARAQQGQIHLVRGAWVNDFLDEITSITAEMTHEHDDWGDTLSALIRRLPEPSRMQRIDANKSQGLMMQKALTGRG